MRGPREPFLSGCCVCGKQYLGNAGDPCPSCGGDVDVAAFKRAIDYKALAADLQQRLAGAKADIAVLQSYDAARESAPSPKCGDDPVLIANRWNGYEGTREPDFDASAEDTASFLAGAVLDMSKQLAARTAELIAMTAARDEACDLLSKLAHRYERGDAYTARVAELRAIGAKP